MATSVLSQRPTHEPQLTPCKHQVAGHLFEDGKAGSFVDECGHFYKPLQNGPRGRREQEFYELIMAILQSEECYHPRRRLSGSYGSRDSAEPSGEGVESSSGASCIQAEERLAEGQTEAGAQPETHLSFSVRNAALLRAIPLCYGLIELDGVRMIEMEDLAGQYRHPSIIDVKMGFHTWYASGDARYIERRKAKDAATHQSSLGFRICGMQVYRNFQRGYWRASKRWCKGLPQEEVRKALLRFPHNESNLRAADVYGGQHGALSQLHQLLQWFKVQQEFVFYSSSILIIYEGDAQKQSETNVVIRLVDFAHTFPVNGERDSNFLNGLASFMSVLEDTVAADTHDDCSL
ncbi:hypothetical protein WJX74_006000 [Apatococcus lobatus]|uniref:Inositol polyphosphate multikinase n=2 Tax=Apatococcus TaxID=904362 RepID=A0AAW1SL12_9CHLO